MIRLGLIGAGGIAGAHVEAMSQMPRRCRLVIQFDTNPVQMQSITKRYPDVESVERIEDFWHASMDAVLITVPNRYHARYVREAAQRGLAVFCEKPLANTVEEAQSMVDAVDTAGVVHMIGFKNRFFPAVQQLHRLIADEGLGRIFAYHEVCSGARLTNPQIGMEWRMRGDLAGGGAVADFGSHSLDMATWLLEDRVGPLDSLHSRLATFVTRQGNYPSNDDMALIDGRFASGTLLSVLDSRVGPGLYQVDVYGAKGYASIDMTQPNQLQVTTYDATAPIRVPDPPVSGKSPFVSQLEAFLDAVEHHQAVEPNFNTGLRVQRWIDMARATAQ